MGAGTPRSSQRHATEITQRPAPLSSVSVDTDKATKRGNVGGIPAHRPSVEIQREATVYVPESLHHLGWRPSDREH